MGKIMFLWGNADDGQNGRSCSSHQPEDCKQWALGGDTFVVGCRIPDDAVVLPRYNVLNPDMADPRYRTEHGMYEPHCGLDALKFAWGHDEYMYRMLVANGCLIPREGLDMIRYHSAYPWHNGASTQFCFGCMPKIDDPPPPHPRTCRLSLSLCIPLFSLSSFSFTARRRQGAYRHLMKPEDYDRMKWVKLFNKFDLYTKVSRTGIRHTSLHCIDRFFFYSAQPPY